jgi:hypothetical protein
MPIEAIEPPITISSNCPERSAIEYLRSGRTRLPMALQP